MFVEGGLYSHCGTYGLWGRIVCSRSGRSGRLSSSSIGGSSCLSILPLGGFPAQRWVKIKEVVGELLVQSRCKDDKYEK
jgi:hypothetical protein